MHEAPNGLIGFSGRAALITCDIHSPCCVSFALNQANIKNCTLLLAMALQVVVLLAMLSCPDVRGHVWQADADVEVGAHISLCFNDDAESKAPSLSSRMRSARRSSTPGEKERVRHTAGSCHSDIAHAPSPKSTKSRLMRDNSLSVFVLQPLRMFRIT